MMMHGLIPVVIGLNTMVNFLLILEADLLCGVPPDWKRAVFSAVTGGIYAGACLSRTFPFLSGIGWRLGMLSVLSLIAFGTGHSGIRRGLLFGLLTIVLTGVIPFSTHRNAPGLLCGGALILLGARYLHIVRPKRPLIQVELCYENRMFHATALQDTGNFLRDPLTGRQVLIAGAEIGEKLLGLSAQQLADPICTLAAGKAPGMRLIPYRTISGQGAMLLAMGMPNVRVGAWRGRAVVAFAPEKIGQGNDYQMLVGGRQI